MNKTTKQEGFFPMEHTGKRALVLAGGGAKGSYQIGVWRALQELDWTPDIITGASVGTLNGCLFTMGKIQEAEDLWRSLEIHDVLEVPATLKPEELHTFFLDIIRSGGLNVEPLAEMIDRLIDEDAVRTSPIHFGLVMTELGSLRSVQCPIEDIPEGQLKDYMLASSACFPALRPREIDGVKYIDGGWRDNMPLDLAAKMGAAELLGVDVDGIGIVRPNTTGLPTRIVRSHWNLGQTLDFDPARAARNIALGYFDTLRLFGRCGGTAYAIVDGGIHHVNYLGGNMGMRVPIIEQSPAREGDMQPWALCGSLCTTADVLVRKAELHPLEQGDVLAFMNIGAYSVTEGPALFLSRDMPRIILRGETGDRLARDVVHSWTLNHE